MNHLGLLTVVLVACHVLQQLDICTASQSESRLRDKLFNNHRTDVRPVVKNSDNVTVLLSLQVNQLVEINENNNYFEMAVWVKQQWVDYQLRWNAR